MEKINNLFEPVMATLGPYLPRVLGALAIVVVAWIAARLARSAALRAATSARIDERLASPGFGAMLAGIASGIVWLLALPALLGTLELQGLLAPVNAMLSRLLGFIPNLLGALVILGIGVLAARIASQVVSGLLRAAGSERAADKLGLGTALGDQGLAGIAGRVVFALVLLPTLVAALQPLGLDALTQPLARLLDTLVALMPKLIAAAILVGVAVLIGRALAGLVTALLAGSGLDNLPERLGAPAFRLAGRSLSDLAGSAVMFGVVLVSVMQATDVLGLPVLTEIVVGAGAALARLAVALVLVVAGLLLATVAARAIEAGALPNRRLVALTARSAILFFTAALALRQAGLPAEIIAIAFGAVVGGIAVAVAVAVGVGGRHVAGRLLERLVASFERDGAPGVGASPLPPAAASPAPSPREP